MELRSTGDETGGVSVDLVLVDSVAAFADCLTERSVFFSDWLDTAAFCDAFFVFATVVFADGFAGFAGFVDTAFDLTTAFFAGFSFGAGVDAAAADLRVRFAG